MRLLLCLFLFAAGTQSLAQDRRLRDTARARAFMKRAMAMPLFEPGRQALLDSTLKYDGGNAYAWQQKSMPLYKQMKYEIAGPFLDSAVKYDPARWLDYRAFMNCVFAKHYREALQDFYLAKATLGDGGVMDHPYDFYIALCHLQGNATDSAVAYLNRCIARRTHNGANGDEAAHYLHWFYLGIARMDLGQLQDAVSCFDKSLKQYPQFSDAEYYKSICLRSLGDRTGALQWMQKAKTDFSAGYSINEDNAFYEKYPYQIIRYYVDAMLRYMQSESRPSAAAPGSSPPGAPSK